VVSWLILSHYLILAVVDMSASFHSCRRMFSDCCVCLDQFVSAELVLRHKPSILSARPRFCSHILHCSRKFLRASRRLIL